MKKEYELSLIKKELKMPILIIYIIKKNLKILEHIQLKMNW